MIKVTEEEISLNCIAKDRNEALQVAAGTLFSRGLVTKSFGNALLKREEEMSTYLGSGVAMPHAAKDNINTVINTGYHFLQFPEGIKWERGKIVFLMIVVAAIKDEHINVLASLADLLGDEMQISLLSTSKSKQEFISLL